MAGISAVGVDDYLAAGKTGIALGPSYNKAARRVYIDAGLVIEEAGGNHSFDDLFPDILPDLFHGYIGPVLGRNHYGVDPDRPPSSYWTVTCSCRRA